MTASPVKIFPSAALPSFSRMTTLAEHLCGLFSDFFLSECNFLDQRKFQCIHLLCGTSRSVQADLQLKH